ncbi:transposase [uncultured Thalassospira sp.]|uniref:transposase n=1 Tax=uncultured Thalassospira sp. TaxID=404382 RepID=UPI002590E0CD|nr:transposase [uncultured Thalassospira sp.]
MTLEYKEDIAMSYTTRFIGIDVSKSALDVCVLPDRHNLRFANTEPGIADLIARIRTYPGLERIVLEPTGGYERMLVRALQAAQLPVSKVNALLVRHFAKASGTLSKTDRIDAFVLADYGQRMSPRLMIKTDDARHELTDLVARRRQLTHMLIQEKNRLEKPDNPARTLIEQSISFLKHQKQEVENLMRQCIDASPVLTAILQVLLSQKGVGFVTACVLIAELPEIGLLEKGQIAKLVGVAPINRDSGMFQGKRMIGGGRREVRNALYYAALPAIRFDPGLRDFYKRLTENGKPSKVAVIAVVRKMVTILNARMRDHYALILDG